MSDRPMRLTKMVLTTAFIMFAVITPAFGQSVSVMTSSNVMQTGNPLNHAHSSSLLQNGPYCNDFERRVVFQDCVMPFGYAHLRFMQHMTSQARCPAEAFDCGRVDYLMRCINRLPVQRVGNQCWPLIPALLTDFFKLYRIPCIFDDIKKQCRTTSHDLLTVEKRSHQGMGIVTSPQQSGGLNPSPQQTPNAVNDAPQQVGTSNYPPQKSSVSQSVLETILHSPSPSQQGQGSNSPSLQALLSSAVQRGSELNTLPQQSSDAIGHSHSHSNLNSQSSSTFNSRSQQVSNSQQPGQSGLARLPQSGNGLNPTQSSTGQQANQSAAALNLRPYCSAAEMNLVFRSCARSYGYAHYRYFQFLARQPTCRAEVFDCRQTDQLIGCLNRLLTTQIANACWILMPDVLTSFLKRYNLPCSFEDIKKQCNNTSQDLLPVEKRIQQQSMLQQQQQQQQRSGYLWG